MVHKNEIDIFVYTKPDCPACDRLKERLKSIMDSNEFIRDNIKQLQYKERLHYIEYPTMVIVDHQSKKELYKMAGAYSVDTLTWKLLKFILRGDGAWQ